MKRTRKTGETCVGDLRLTQRDVGVDLRLVGMAVNLPEKFTSVGIEENGETYLVEGSREELIAAIKAAGYTVSLGLS